MIALATFAAVGTGSPGPNNTLLLASGMTFGLRRTIPHVAGTALGMALLIGVVAAGAGALITTVPGVRLVLKVVASAYLLYLAARLARGVTLDPVAAHEPFSLGRAVAFQFVNPKAWVFVLALVGASSTSSGSWIGVGVTVLVVSAIVAATAGLWALGGTTISRVVEGDRGRRWVGVALGLLLLVSVGLLWL